MGPGRVAPAGLARSTVQRIVNALAAERLVMSLPQGGGYRLGPEIQAMAAASRLDIANDIRAYLAALSEATGETVDLAAFREDHMVFIDQIVGSHRLRAVATVGETFPLTAPANGKACLAMLDNDTIEALATRLVLAGRAEMTIDAQYYLIGRDPAARLFVESLLTAADRGVRVRLLMGSHSH